VVVGMAILEYPTAQSRKQEHKNGGVGLRNANLPIGDFKGANREIDVPGCVAMAAMVDALGNPLQTHDIFTINVLDNTTLNIYNGCV
jgi:hypothetical protein